MTLADVKTDFRDANTRADEKPARTEKIRPKVYDRVIIKLKCFSRASHLYHYESHLFCNLNRSSNNHLTSFNLLRLFSFAGAQAPSNVLMAKAVRGFSHQLNLNFIVLHFGSD